MKTVFHDLSCVCFKRNTWDILEGYFIICNICQEFLIQSSFTYTSHLKFVVKFPCLSRLFSIESCSPTDNMQTFSQRAVGGVVVFLQLYFCWS